MCRRKGFPSIFWDRLCSNVCVHVYACNPCAHQCFLRVWENLDYISPPIWEFEKLGSHIEFILLPQPGIW